MKPTTLATAIVAMALAVAAPAHADPDTDFARELHSYGIYGARDYNAWLGKITCERLRNGVDPDAAASSRFIFNNLTKRAAPPPSDVQTAQSWKFLGASINAYCPDQRGVFERAAGQ